MLIALLLLSINIELTTACSDIGIRAKDGTVVIGRSMDIDFGLIPGIYIEPSGMIKQGKLPAVCKGEGMEWTNKHNVIVIRPMQSSLEFISVDGINDAGLNAASLYMPGYTVYEDVSGAKCRHTISQLEVIGYVLSNFENVKQIREVLETNKFPYIWGIKVFGMVQPGHYTFSDRSGDSIVLEYSAAGRKYYNNTLGVMTNSPTFDWHLWNMKRYAYMFQPTTNKKTAYYDGQNQLHSIGIDKNSALSGLPGDFSSPTRFVRASVLKHKAYQADSGKDAVVLAFHLLGSVELQKGAVQGRWGFKQYTFWQMASDLKNNCVYFRSHGSLSIQKICIPDGPFAYASMQMTRSFDEGVQNVSKMFRQTA